MLTSIIAIFVLKLFLIEISANNLNIRQQRGDLLDIYSDLNVNPCDNFYKYACGNWKLFNRRPEETVPYDNLYIFKTKVLSQQMKLLEEFSLDSKNSSTSPEIKAKQFYLSCINNELSENQIIYHMINILQSWSSWPLLDKNWQSLNFDLTNVIANLRLIGLQPLFRENVGYWHESNETRIFLTYPKFEILTKNDLLMRSINSEENIFLYERYIKNLMLKLGLKIRSARKIAQEIVDFEKSIAILTEFDETASVRQIKNLQELLPQIDWLKYFTIIFDKSINSSQSIMIEEAYYRKLSELITQTDTRIIANYLLFRVMFYYKIGLNANNQNIPKECTKEISTKMSSVIGSMFVRQHFDERTKNEILIMVKNLQLIFLNILNSTEWLDMKTKISIKSKLEAMSIYIGYPDNILSNENLALEYDDLEIDPYNYYTNILNYARHETRKEHKGILQNLKDNRLNFNPMDTNAFYKLGQNAIIIPAAILQPPIYNYDYPNSYNYGVLGSILGHEMFHGFDTTGRYFNFEGKNGDWWTGKSIVGYNRETNCFIRQYTNYTDELNSYKTFDENVADNVGIRLAFHAYKKWCNENLIINENFNQINMNNKKIFFLSFAQFWCNSEDTNLKYDSSSSVHSANILRVNAVLANFDEFSIAFNCHRNSIMNREDKCVLW